MLLLLCQSLIPHCVTQASRNHALSSCTGELQDPHHYLRPLHAHHCVAVEPLLQRHLPQVPASCCLGGSQSQGGGFQYQQPAAPSATSRATARCRQFQIRRDRLPDQRRGQHQMSAGRRRDLHALWLDGKIL